MDNDSFFRDLETPKTNMETSVPKSDLPSSMTFDPFASTTTNIKSDNADFFTDFTKFENDFNNLKMNEINIEDAKNEPKAAHFYRTNLDQSSKPDTETNPKSRDDIFGDLLGEQGYDFATKRYIFF